MPLACYLLCSPFWVVTVAFCKEWFPWENCKPMQYIPCYLSYQCYIIDLFLVIDRLLTLSIYLAGAAVLIWSFVPLFLKLMTQLSSQVGVFKHFKFSVTLLYFQINISRFKMHKTTAVKTWEAYGPSHFYSR